MSEPTAASFLPTTYELLASVIRAQDGEDGGGRDGSSQRWSSFIGIVTAICGNILISFALNIQRYAHIRIEREAEGERVRLGLRRRRTSSTYGSVSAPDRDDATGERGRPGLNGSLRSRSTRILYGDEDEESLEHDRLQESFLSDRTMKSGRRGLVPVDRTSYLRSPYWWLGLVLMTLGEAGNFLAYGFAPASIVSPLGVVALISNCVIAPFMLKEEFRKRDFWGVLIAIAGAVVVVLSAKTSETKLGPHDIWVMITRWEFELYLGLTAVLIVTLMSLSRKYGGRTILIDLGLVGLFGSYTALSTKGVASLLSFTLWHVITFPITYLLVAILVVTALMQIRYVNRALQRFDSTQVIPTQFVLFTLSVIIGSAILYRDFESTTASQAGKFVGGCFMTFLGVYLITSGRDRGEDEYSEEGDEEEAMGLLQGEPYEDSVDVSPSGPDRRIDKSGRTTTGQQDLSRSPRGSLLSVDDHEDALRTPRGVLSPAPSSREGSLSDGSLSPSYRDPASSPPRPASLTENPWAASPERTIKASMSNQAVYETVPSTPSDQSSHEPQPPHLLFRFPAAPTSDEPAPATNGEEQGDADVSIQPTADPRTPERRQHGTPHTPQSSSRNSLTLRFTPAPLLPPISSTLNAVVAESLRRGEGSPGRHRRVKSLARRRKSIVPAIGGDSHHDGDGEAGETEYETEVSADDGQYHSSGAVTSTPGASRKNSSGEVPTRANIEAETAANKDGGSGAMTRVRSLSDSWSGGLSWLGGTLRRSGTSRRRTILQKSVRRREQRQ
ncbi:DUF803 domain membrane protein [Rasamsonia emersonii CBS 393.64]|uniref:DUF803 domain membrane protein n=1 Tax=Rasamsonia emersonii (strain ATCC 16479 / CBS 393.64 / IMI 116815) TaxID=1408163 RepID=A0A0F4YT24_RASE3|nr:DUF803 domain membrane protein [Rasamsonia emersonii CBS 393.64]KKA21437.1 DUF803 domain membrane protein [Rasamsonia emersonii CBS 393.64]